MDQNYYEVKLQIELAFASSAKPQKLKAVKYALENWGSRIQKEWNERQRHDNVATLLEYLMRSAAIQDLTPKMQRKISLLSPDIFLSILGITGFKRQDYFHRVEKSGSKISLKALENSLNNWKDKSNNKSTIKEFLKETELLRKKKIIVLLDD